MYNGQSKCSERKPLLSHSCTDILLCSCMAALRHELGIHRDMVWLSELYELPCCVKLLSKRSHSQVMEIEICDIGFGSRSLCLLHQQFLK